MSALSTFQLRGILPLILPRRDHTLLLRACLAVDQQARQAWEAWLKLVGDPKSAFERDQSGLKGLLPFIQHSLNKNQLDVDEQFRTYLRVSILREELRSDIYRTILRDVLSTLHSTDIREIVLKGAALSETVYDHPNVRHNHAIDILLRDAELSDAARVLRRLHVKENEDGGPKRLHHREFVHETGLPIVLHTQLFLLPYYQADLERLWQRAKACDFGGEKSLVLSSADNLLHVLGHASYSRSRFNLRWACDAYLILARTPDIDWDLVLRDASKYHINMPLLMMLEYLSKELHAKVPAEVLRKLAAMQISKGSLAHEAVFAGALMGAGSPIKVLRRLKSDIRTTIRLGRFILFPSRVYLQWRYGISNPALISVLYVYRPVKYLMWRIFRAFRIRHQRNAKDKRFVPGQI